MNTTTISVQEWLKQLGSALRPMYTQPKVPGGHDFLHVERMIKRGPEILTIIDFDLDEFSAAVWLHNLDRVKKFSQEIDEIGRKMLRSSSNYFDNSVYDDSDERAVVFKMGLSLLCEKYLIDSPFDAEARRRIIDAVMQHAKKDDDLERDSTLLTAVRIADKIDAIGALRITMIAGHSGPKLLPYNPEKPFGYESTDANRMRTVYEDFFRVTEWYKMLPSNEARALIPEENFRFFLNFIRRFGQEIAEATGFENRVEDDIKKALGKYYEHFRWE